MTGTYFFGRQSQNGPECKT